MKPATRTIHQTVTFEAPSKRIYEALMDSAKHASFTGEAASIDPSRGGSFSCYGTYITGITLELEPNKSIVQAWRSRNWPKGVYSLVTFRLKTRGAHRTELEFSQSGVPAKDYHAKNAGWKSHYWKPLAQYLETMGSAT
jgi:activator of HSP90 ATPase